MKSVLIAFQIVVTVVAPLAGAWIEIINSRNESILPESLPSRERGLKYMEAAHMDLQRFVAPLAGAWIEIFL